MSNVVGRPTVIDEATVQKLEAAFRDGFSISTACFLSGISRSTYYDHCDSDKEFSDKMSVARMWVTEQAKKVVVGAINNGDLPTAKWWLERRAQDEFGKETGTEIEQEAERQYRKLDEIIKAFLNDTSDLEEQPA